MDLKLLKGALCAAISLWDSGIGSGAQKQSSLFSSWKASEQVSHSECMTNAWRGDERGSEGLGMCVTEPYGMDGYYTNTYSTNSLRWLHRCFYLKCIIEVSKASLLIKVSPPPRCNDRVSGPEAVKGGGRGARVGSGPGDRPTSVRGYPRG